MKRKEKEQMIGEILDAALACRWEAHGAPVQAAQVAAKAGMSTRTLNRYFSDKDVMMFEASARFLEKKYEEIAQRYQQLKMDGLNGRERLICFLNAQIEAYRSSPQEAAMFVVANISCVSISVVKGCRRPGFGSELTRILLSNVRLGQEDGSVRPELDPKKTCLLIAANFNGIMQRLMFLMNTETCFDSADMFNILEEYTRMLNGYLKPGFQG